MDRDQLRPVERVVLRMRDEGLSDDDIARRIRRSPQHVERIVAWSTWPRSGASSHRKGLSPLERRVLAMRAEGWTMRSWRPDSAAARRTCGGSRAWPTSGWVTG